MAHLAWHAIHVLCIIFYVGLIPTGVLSFTYIANNGNSRRWGYEGVMYLSWAVSGLGVLVALFNVLIYTLLARYDRAVSYSQPASRRLRKFKVVLIISWVFNVIFMAADALAATSYDRAARGVDEATARYLRATEGFAVMCFIVTLATIVADLAKYLIDRRNLRQSAESYKIDVPANHGAQYL